MRQLPNKARELSDAELRRIHAYFEAEVPVKNIAKSCRLPRRIVEQIYREWRKN